MELKGKKISFLGDSITEGSGTSGVNARFSTLVGIGGEFGEVKNYGISGTRIARQTNPSENKRFDLDFCLRVEEIDEDSDIVMVFGGTNDYDHGDAVIGTKYDDSVNTFYGASKYLMKRLVERFPGKPVVIMTPLHRRGDSNPRLTHKAPYAYTLKTYVDVIREVAEMYSLPVLDLYATAGIVPDIDIIRDRYCPDGLHPNDAGHVILSEKILSFLRAL